MPSDNSTFEQAVEALYHLNLGGSKSQGLAYLLFQSGKLQWITEETESGRRPRYNLATPAPALPQSCALPRRKPGG